MERDRQTVDAEGVPTAALPAGVTFREAITHADGRGSVCEMFDRRWAWHDDELLFVYMFTVRPGAIKGWGMHERHEDRYFIQFGELEVVLYDGREDSETHGLVSTVMLTEHHRRLMNIPAGVWHANRNVGARDAVVVNFPTIPYDHADPDKYRLPLDTEEIPYTWDDLRGW
ncbi:MAG: hypothetical protein WBC01_03545 [Solirubrobacterales bacterium]